MSDRPSDDPASDDPTNDDPGAGVDVSGDDRGAEDEAVFDEVEFDETELQDGQLAYECAAWAGESRGMLTSLLTSASIGHAWQGTTLTVREEDEEVVDDLIDEVLAAARPALDPDAAKVVFAVGEWPVSLQTELVDALTVEDLAYEWDERGDLVVLESDEEQVTAVLEELPEPDEDEMSSDDGVAVHELFDAIFMASSKLTKHPTDAASTVGIVVWAEFIERLALPFGFEPAQWRQLVGEVAALRTTIDAPESADSDEVVLPPSDAEVALQAERVRDLIRQYI